MNSYFFFRCFPYCLKRIDEYNFVALNRLYKPIGFDQTQSGWVDYRSLPIGLSTARISWLELAKLLDYVIEPATEDLIYLYNADSAPISGWGKPKILEERWKVYTQKLHKLAALKIK